MTTFWYIIILITGYWLFSFPSTRIFYDWIWGFLNYWKKETYKHLNEEFQRIARRDKKVFLSDQCKEIEENNRTGKTRDLFKKIRDTKGTFYAKMGSVKDRNGRDLTETKDIKKRWQEYPEELYKKGLHDPDNHDGVITPRARYPGMWSQVGLRKHHYE